MIFFFIHVALLVLFLSRGTLLYMCCFSFFSGEAHNHPRGKSTKPEQDEEGSFNVLSSGNSISDGAEIDGETARFDLSRDSAG